MRENKQQLEGIFLVLRLNNQLCNTKKYQVSYKELNKLVMELCWTILSITKLKDEWSFNLSFLKTLKNKKVTEVEQRSKILHKESLWQNASNTKEQLTV